MPDHLPLDHAATVPLAALTASQLNDVLALGASEVEDRGEFSHAVRELHPGGVDAAIDVVGRAGTRSALASVRDGGSTISSFHDYDDPTRTLRSERGIRVETHVVHPDTADLADLLESAGRGTLSTAIAQSYPLTQAAEAHRRLEQGGVRGKLVLIP